VGYGLFLMASAGEYRVDHPLDLPPLDVPGILRRHGLRPDKSLGQSFLLDPVALRRVVEAAEVESMDAVLEIGAGAGSLTRYLAVASRRVVAVELDSDLIPILKQVLAPYPNTEIVEGDILTKDPARLMAELTFDQDGQVSEPDYLVVANIPYYITSALIRRLLESQPRPRRLVLTVQKEVAHRICAAPGDMSLLALSVQVYGEPRVVLNIPAGSFYPPPKVDSAVVRVDLYSEPLIASNLLDIFFRLAKAGFGQKRKTLRNALTAGLSWPVGKVEAFLQEAGIDHMRRAETLDLTEWKILTELYGSFKDR
jgi:16S rRNA (adenine1518-N6/adenine1519-N6)-dimethyltransferase